MNKSIKFLSVLLIVILISIAVMPSAYALTSKYNFTSNENGNKQLEDEFTYRNDCFTRSSFLGCSHLEVLSAQAAISSASWYGENEDQYEVDYSQNAHNVVGLLNEMGFEDVSTNKYYTLEKEENSVGVAVGHRTITVNEKEYTLIAIFPRSASYKQEWAGNFTVEDGDIHFGFKSARDEILRYVKQYINTNNIKGDLKVWTAGHSRGAAISNMVGGFFAGGGIEYFGDDVSITPEDVYCYTFATPRPIKDGADKNTELSVAANRTDANYQNDTPGEAFNYTKGGTVDVKSEVYGGVRNFLSPNDVFTMLPPETWGFTHYGNDISIDHNVITEEAMLEKLKETSLYAYNRYLNGGNPNSFERKTFDLKTLSIVKDEGTYSAMDMGTFIKDRLKGLTYKSSTNKIYKDNNYQDALKSVAGIYGMSMTLFDEGIKMSDLTSPLIFSYLSYTSERLQEEGKATSETEAIAIAIEELLVYFTGTETEIDNETFTVDDFMVLLAKYISDNENEPIANTIISEIIGFVPANLQSFLAIFKAFDKNNTEEHEVTMEEGLKAFIKACYYGVDPECSVAAHYPNAESVREALYGLLNFALSSNYPEISTVLTDENGKQNAKGKFKDLVGIILNNLKIVKDEQQNVIKTYTDFAEMADDKLKEAIDKLLQTPLEKARNLYGEDYANKLSGHIENVKQNISEVRNLVLYFLMYEDGEYSVKNDVKNLTTFIGNVSIIPLAHYNELNIAYAKAAKDFDCGYEEHDSEYICTEGKNQEVNITKSDTLKFVFNIDFEIFKREGKVFIDGNEVSRDNYTMSKGSTVITFNDEFTKTLSVGKHTIKVATDEGSGEAEFTLSESNVPESEPENNNETQTNDNQKSQNGNPKTGDDILIYVRLLAVSMFGVILTVIYKKRIK